MPIDPTDPPARTPHIPSVMGLTTTQTPEDEVPTIDQVDEDPVALAKRLAAEAKAKAAAQAPEEDPVALARRLAAEAKAKAAAQAPKEDPVALARRLAAEAKAKAAAQAPREDPVALARRLAAEAKAKAAAAAPPATRSSAAAAPKRKKKRSAAEILAEARAKEASAPTSTPPAAKAPPAAVAETPAPAAAPAPEPAPTPAADAFDVEAVALGVLPGGTVERVAHPDSTVVLRAVWQAHLARAQSSQDAALAVSAAALLGALERIGVEGLAAVEVSYGGEQHAIFVDTTRGHALACASPANVYLAGM